MLQEYRCLFYYSVVKVVAVYRLNTHIKANLHLEKRARVNVIVCNSGVFSFVFDGM